MKGAAAIDGSFADFKLVKTRSVAQLIIEIPIERADQALNALGGVPRYDSERPVAIARLAVQSDPVQPKQRRDFEELALSQQSALLCGKQDFWRFLANRYHKAITSEEEAATAVRQGCNVNSRSQFDTDQVAAGKFVKLRDSFVAGAA